MKRKNELMYERFVQLTIVDVLPHIGKPTYNFWVPDLKIHIPVHMSTERMRLIGRTQVCACCGAVGDHFWLERSGCWSPHLNLYAINRHGNLCMLTKDHIIPRCRGGKTVAANLQLLCANCNRRKDNKLLTLEELRRKMGIRQP